MKRTVKNTVKGFRTVDGDGVNLVRVLGNSTAEEFDPILMLDSFDSTDPGEYTGGFPMHPHRGIETISYLWKGNMVHRDSLGNEDSISDGEVQWMNSGSGILHEELVPAAERLLGAQLWLNLPGKEKMCRPSYRSIHREEIGEKSFRGGYLRVLAGSYQELTGHQGEHLPLDYYDIHLEKGGELTIETGEEDFVMLFTLLGEVTVEGQRVEEKTAARLTAGSSVTLNAENGDAQVLFIRSIPLREAIAWAGPIVMNTEEELREAFQELRSGEFLKEGAAY